MSSTPEVATDRLYTRQFFQTFVAVGLFMMGVALQFHFGEYLAYLGHGVSTLGRVLSIAMVGRLLIRLQVGRWIDRFGCRPIWLVGTLLLAGAMGAMQFTTRLWLITALQALSVMSIAAVMTAVPVFAAQIAPPHRRAESIGTIGLAGFMGIMIGPTIGDWIFSAPTTSITPYRIFFSLSALCSILAGAVMAWMGQPPVHRHPLPDPPLAPSMADASQSQIRAIVRHWPGTVMLVGVAFSMALCLQYLFLERLAEERGFKDIKLFFLIYAPTAMALRVVFRRLPEEVGRSPVLVGGLLLMGAGLLCLVGIESQSQLVVPALLMGAGHCFIFPSMIDLAAERLPSEQRGTGTALILGAGDLGMLIGFVVLGEVIEAAGFDVALVMLAGATLFGAGVFGLSSLGTKLSSRRGREDAG